MADRPAAGTPYTDPCAVADNAEVFGKLLNEPGAQTTYNGVTLVSYQDALDGFGFGVAPFTFATGGILASLNLLVSNAPTSNLLYKYIGSGSAPITVTAGTNPVGNPNWQAFAATSLQALSGLTEPSDLDDVYTRVFASVGDMQAGTSFSVEQCLAIAGTDSRGKTSTNQFFTVVDTAAEIDLGGGLWASPLRFQTERLRVGNAAAPSSTWERDAVLVSRNLTGLTDTHAFTDYTVISGVTDGGTYGAFDVKTSVTGTHLQDHVYSFQDRIQSSVDNLAKTTGLYSRPELNAGNIGTRKAIDVYDPVGGGNLSQNYGLFVRELLFGNSINQAVRTEGITPSSFGGVMAIGSVNSTTNIGPDFSIQLKVGGQQLQGAATLGILVNNDVPNTSTSSYYAIQTTPELKAGLNLPICVGFRATNTILQGGATLGEQYGFFISDLTSGGTRNYGLFSSVSDGVGKKNIAVGGTAPNSYAGNSYFGGPTSSVPTAKVHCAPGTSAPNTAPLKLSAGTNLTTPENGAFEFNGTNLYFTVGGVRRTVQLV